MTDFYQALRQGTEELGIELTQSQEKQFFSYWQLLVEWNQKFNLTAILEEKEVIVKHFLDSLTCLVALPFKTGMSVIDVGTGAGFPGIPLLIKEPGLKLTLLDSLQKRTLFLAEVVRKLGLPEANIIHGRAEDFGSSLEYRERFDVAVTRAVAKVSVIAEYCLPFVKPGGSFLAMKGPEFDEELSLGQSALKLLGGGSSFIKQVKLPFSRDERNLLVVVKTNHTPKEFPRKAGLPGKNPL